MPRRTRRSEEPSAAPQSEEGLTDSAAIENPADSSGVNEAQAQPVKPKSVRRRAPAKTTKVTAEDEPVIGELEATSPDQSADRPVRRRTPRRKEVVKTTEDSGQVDSVTESFVDLFSEAPVDDVATPVTPQPRTIRQPPPLRRRVGGRRSEAEAAVAGSADQEIVPVEAAPTSEPTPAPSSRNRRRRGNKRPESTEAQQPLSANVDAGEEGSGLLDLAVESIVPTDPAATEEDHKRSRRSRRGGRRRSGRPAEGETAEDSEAETLVDEIEDDDAGISVLSPPPPPFIAPRLVPVAADLGLTQSVMRTTAVLSDGTPGFVINGEYFGPELFFVNSETAEDVTIVGDQIRLAAGAGIHIHSGVAYLPLKNAFGVRSFTSVQTLIKQVVESDPSGYILVRLQCVPTNFWARMHPDEMAVYSDGSVGDVSFSSSSFWQDTVDALEALIHYFADPETPGGDRVIGIHLDKGEWFNDANLGYDYSQPNKVAFQQWLHERYQTPYALRAAWFSGNAVFESAEIPRWLGTLASRKKEEVVLYNRPRDRRYVDYNTYTSDIMAQGITGVADAVKWLSDGNLLVGASYGYTFEFATRNDSGHQALSKVLASPSIDIIAGPNSYSTRKAGAAGSFSSPVDSAQLNGKLWIVEDDTKTFLAADETEDAFNPKVATLQDTISVLRRNAAAAAVHGCGISWMDLWGNGWLNSQEIWDEIAELRNQAAVARRLRLDIKQVPEVAILVDEGSYSHICGDPSGITLQSGLISKSLELIYRSGASIGYYLQNDVSLLPEGIKLYVFLNPLRVTTAERQAIREKLQKPGKTLAWIYAPGLFDEKGDSPTEVSEIVGMPLKAQPWNSRIGTIFTEERHPVTERLHGGKRLGSDDVLNPSYAIADPAAIILGEYSQSGSPSIAAKINEGGWKSVFIGEPHLTGELLRGLYRFAGISVYDMQDDIVHASASGLLLIHSPYTGQRTVHLPRPASVYSLYERRLVTQQSSTFRTFMRGRATNFFLWGELERIADAVGSTPDELKQQHAAWKAERDSNQQRNPRGQQGREQSSEDGDSEGDYAPSDDGDTGRDQITDNVDITVAEVSVSAPTMVTAVSALIESGLIAGDIESVEGDLPDEESDGNETPAEQSTTAAQPMSPSRRRRWNRKRNMQAAKSASPPAISMEDLLSDLPPRKPMPPKAED